MKAEHKLQMMDLRIFWLIWNRLMLELWENIQQLMY